FLHDALPILSHGGCGGGSWLQALLAVSSGSCPRNSFRLGTSAVLRRALGLIDEGILDRGSVEDLANCLGIGGGHLHRLFMKHVGASPVDLAQTRRLHFAKRLLDETK